MFREKKAIALDDFLYTVLTFTALTHPGRALHLQKPCALSAIFDGKIWMNFYLEPIRKKKRVQLFSIWRAR